MHASSKVTFIWKQPSTLKANARTRVIWNEITDETICNEIVTQVSERRNAGPDHSLLSR